MREREREVLLEETIVPKIIQRRKYEYKATVD
jgi:hypothetical protein